MSLIQKIQEKGAWIIFIAIALALLAFILMDSFSSGRGGGLFSDNSTLAKVNGETIDRQKFENRLNQIQQMQGEQASREDLSAEVFNYEVRNVVMNQEFEKLGIALAGKDLDNAMFGERPPSFLAQQFTDPQTGVYDANAARNFIAQVRKEKNNPQLTQTLQMIEMGMQQLSEQIVNQKYQSMIVGATHIPKWLVEKSVADANAVASISYVNVPYTSISDSAVQVTDADITAFVNKHKKQFEQKEDFRDMSVVTFNAGPSSADSAAQLAAAQKLKQEFASATDLKSFVDLQNNSNMAYYDGYISSKELQDPLKDTIISQPVGTIVGPIVENGNIVLAKLVGAAPIADTVNARFLIVATHGPDAQGQTVQFRTDTAARQRIDTALALVRTGTSFDSAVARYSDNRENSRLENITSSQLVQMGSPELSNFLLTGNINESKVVKIQNGFLLAQITGKSGSSMGYKIARIVKPLAPSSETISEASTAANHFAANSRDAKSFEENARKQNLPVMPVQGIRQNDYRIGNLGSDRQLVRWLYEGKVGDVSEPVQIGDQFVVARINAVSKKGLPSAATVRPYVESFLRNEKKAKMIINTKFKGNTLEAIAQAAGVQVSRADSISFYGQMVPGIGMEPKITGAAFNKTIQGKVSKPIAGNIGVFAIKGEGISALPGTNAENIRQTLFQSWLQQIFQRSMNALIESADIKDNRFKFY